MQFVHHMGCVTDFYEALAFTSSVAFAQTDPFQSIGSATTYQLPPLDARALVLAPLCHEGNALEQAHLSDNSINPSKYFTRNVLLGYMRSKICAYMLNTVFPQCMRAHAMSYPSLYTVGTQSNRFSAT